ncbi:hypothetical protein HDF16_005511 [Granulicella aggregans]|jgi:hypothetical protein|uniref:Uncharacterized protein n=1 Tax=Granulicella aggregans TaxID=474949 RepID=A0A7W7ZIZ0_9BACT|nr:hypothetical protein [Granulicella aggregans]
MMKFTFKLKVTERITAKCSRHPRYNPEKEGRNGIKGGCSGCFALFDLYQSRLALEAAVQKFQRLACPWARPRQPRTHKPTPPVTNLVEDESR